MRVIVVDPFDSFVHILKQYLLSLGVDALVVRSDAFAAELTDEWGADALLLGPGPGHPADSGHVEIIREHGGRTPILGVCLGLQAIGLAAGADVVRAGELVHGKTSALSHDGRGMFRGVPQGVSVMRYHSLAVDPATVPAGMRVSATAAGEVMGLRHERAPIEGTQFHPESVGTEHGLAMVGNFLESFERRELAS